MTRPSTPAQTRQWVPRGYTADRLLGCGASAEVWRARAGSAGPAVALKHLRHPDPDAAARARREAALLSALDHPNVVRLHAALPCRDGLVLVLDLAEHGSLADVLHVRGRLATSEVVAALAPVAAALAYLHGHEVVHGDVSAANVLFTADGTPVLSDVGVARLLGEPGEVRCTPVYVAPEVAAGLVPEPAADVFSLAALAVHALTGRPLWPDAGPPVATLARAVGGTPTDTGDRLRRAGVPRAVVDVVLRGLADIPAERGSAIAFALDLRHAASPVAVEFAAGRDRPPAPGADTVTTRLQARPRPPLPDRRRRAAPLLRLPGRHRSADGARARHSTRGRVVAACCLSALLAVVVAVSAHRSSRSPAPDAAARWGGVLTRLDAVRARAWAQRAPRLLAGVYVRGPLLVSDTRRLTSSVPAGCGIAGAVTSYRVLDVRPTTDGATVVVSARLPASRLVCHGRTRAVVPGVAPVRLQVALVGSGPAARIADQRPVRAGG